jgi:predicted alpha/beta-hydrolase family hydrolase
MSAPRRPPGLLLAPGAGADRNQSALVAIDEAVSATGVEVLRMDFPYRAAGRRAPDRPAVLLEAVGAHAAKLSERACPLALGGRSMGGRMCSMAVAAGLPAAGLVLLSYPLHPPGRPDKLRIEHLRALDVACLFISGERDAFATRDELEAATAVIPAPVTHHWIAGKDHALRGVDAAVATLVTDWLSTLWPAVARSRARRRDPRVPRPPSRGTPATPAPPTPPG